MEGTKLEAVTASGTTVKALSHLEVRMRRCHNWIWLMGTALESVIVGRSSWSCGVRVWWAQSHIMELLGVDCTKASTEMKQSRGPKVRLSWLCEVYQECIEQEL
ncbi:hypothetical protein LR48_Vigan10g187900 [Vigna angularis]|uniref:Uncharacterized protein n=1 Tax=Phaseolus angularis TaxID=3914 RepID=A0A0L9VM85_PHAAN|nr:hypothetical protein LR48_Vigan10g187900 [Vigna angularis]